MKNLKHLKDGCATERGPLSRALKSDIGQGLDFMATTTQGWRADLAILSLPMGSQGFPYRKVLGILLTYVLQKHPISDVPPGYRSDLQSCSVNRRSHLILQSSLHPSSSAKGSGPPQVRIASKERKQEREMERERERTRKREEEGERNGGRKRKIECTLAAS